MIILGIETSCDETAASVVENGTKILSHIVASSAQMHTKSGGIIPENAAREQVKSIIPVIETALLEGVNWKVATSPTPPIDAIAVTVGPGLIGSLLVGVETAKTLACVWDKPLVPVNHLVAHLYANWLNNKTPTLPAVALVVSGGHTDLILLKNHGQIEWIGGTRDDAAGEAFDKTARLLGLPYPGGPAIADAAANFKILNSRQRRGSPEAARFSIQLPRPMIDEENFDFSFSGLKTAVIREVNQLKLRGALDDLTTQELAHEIQEAIVDVLVSKTLKAVQKYQAPTLLVAGGVSANQRLKEKFLLKIENFKLKIDFRIPPPELCTDNASYIAAYAEYNFKTLPWERVTANPSLTIKEV